MRLTGLLSRNILFAILLSKFNKIKQLDKTYSCAFPTLFWTCTSINENNEVAVDKISLLCPCFFEEDEIVYLTYQKEILKKNILDVVVNQNAKEWKDLPENLTLQFKIEYDEKYQKNILEKMFKDYKITKETELLKLPFSGTIRKNFLVCSFNTKKSTLECFLDVFEDELSDKELYEKHGENVVKKVAECYSDPFVFEYLKEKLNSFRMQSETLGVKQAYMQMKYEREIDRLRKECESNIYKNFAKDSDCSEHEAKKSALKKELYLKEVELKKELAQKIKKQKEKEQTDMMELALDIENTRRNIR